jgi:hypothetical protein
MFLICKFICEFTLIGMNSLDFSASAHIRLPAPKRLRLEPKLDNITDYNETMLKDAAEFVIEITVTSLENRKCCPGSRPDLVVSDNIQLGELVRVCVVSNMQQ